MVKFYLTKNSLETRRLGEDLIKIFLKAKNNKNALIFALEGELGSGKTTFLQGAAKGLKIKERVLSPTFIIMKKFHIKNYRYGINNFYHFDCYRIEGSKEILNLGFKEITSSPENIVSIEWASKIKKIMPKGAIWIKFKFTGEKTRKIIIAD